MPEAFHVDLFMIFKVRKFNKNYLLCMHNIYKIFIIF